MALLAAAKRRQLISKPLQTSPCFFLHYLRKILLRNNVLAAMAHGVAGETPR
jgi:hypothetical protein